MTPRLPPREARIELSGRRKAELEARKSMRFT